MLNQRITKMLLLLVFTSSLCGCASMFEPDFIKKSEPTETQTGSMEPYVECLRDKKREETDPPCLLK